MCDAACGNAVEQTPALAPPVAGGRASEVRRARAVVAALNVERKRQTRDLLARYASLQQGTVPQPMVKPPSDPDAPCVQVGKTYAMLFARGSSKQPIIEVFVARVHGLIAAPVASKAGSKSDAGGRRSLLRHFLSVPQADTTAMYECHPYALVCPATAGAVELKLSDDVHQWLPCCESTCAGELLSGLDSDSEQEEDDEDGSECEKRAKVDCAASNIKCEVDVAWDAVGGPVVSQDSVQQLLGLLDGLAEHKQAAGKAAGTAAGKAAEQEGMQQQGGGPWPTKRQRHAQQQAAEQGGRQPQSGRQQHGGGQQQQAVVSTSGRKIRPPGWRASDM